MTAPASVATLRLAQPPTPDAPLVLLFHGRGSDERSMAALAPTLPADAEVIAVRGPVALPGAGFTWFENQGLGRPVPASLAASMDLVESWLDDVAAGRRVVLVGFSGGALFAAALALRSPDRYAALAVLLGAVPFADGGADESPDRLAGLDVLVVHAEDDETMPAPLMARAWTHLTEVSGGQVQAHHVHGGHTLTPETLGLLREWLVEVTR